MPQPLKPDEHHRRLERLEELGMEHWKMQADYFKHLGAMSGAGIAGVGVVSGLLGAALPEVSQPWIVYYALVFFLLLLFGSTGATSLAIVMAGRTSLSDIQGAEADRDFAWFNRIRRITMGNFTLGVLAFGLLIALNVPA